MNIGLHHTHIFASDIETTLRFWQDMFGAEVLLDMEMAGARNVMIGIGTGKINIYNQPPREGKGGACHHLGLQTDDLDALVKHMQDRGFRFHGPVKDHGFLKYMMAMAPDHILVELFQIIPGEAPAEQRVSLFRAFGCHPVS
jgi:catechol 2,3-dioxygenase-like lactoylglutathione lyase family enzyme